MKNCSTCKQQKSLDSFDRKKSAKDGRRSRCKECRHQLELEQAKERNLLHYHLNKDVISAKQKEKYNSKVRVNSYSYEKTKNLDLKREFGINLEIYNEMLANQKGVCAICFLPESNVALAVDHCHETGLIRGLLCGKCNRALGLLQDNPALMRIAALYVETGGICA